VPEGIIAIYCVCDDLCKLLGIQDDRQAQVTTAEVMTTALVAAWLFHGNLELIRAFLKAEGYIPQMLGSSRLNRRLHRIPEGVWRLLLHLLGKAHRQAEDTQEYIVDSMPVAACALARADHSKLYPHAAGGFLGYCASKEEYLYGLRLHLLTTASGQPIEFTLAPGAMADVRAVKLLEFPVEPGAIVYADKAYNDYQFDLLLEDALGIVFRPLRRKRSVLTPPGWLTYIIGHMRKRIESSFARITQFLPKHIHATTARGFELKTALFVIAFALCG